MENSTERRVPIRVLMRAAGLDVRDLVTHIQGHRVVIIGPAKRDEWDGLWRDGDLEAFAWVGISSVNQAIGELRALAEVIDARVTMRDQK